MDLESTADRWRAATAEAPLPEPVTQASLSWLASPDEDTEEHAARVALHARGEAEAGRPAGTVLAPFWMLFELVPSEKRPPLRRLLALVADAHTLGVSSRSEQLRRQRLRETTPVLELPDGRVLAALVGPIDGEILDAVLGRAFALAMGIGAEELVIEVGTLDDRDAETVLDALGFYPRHELAARLKLSVTGLDAPSRWEAALRERGVPSELVRFRARIADPKPL